MTGKIIDIIKRAMLLVGVVDPREAPSGSDADTCLNELRDLIPALPGWSGWTQVVIDRDWAPQGEDYRITVIGEAEVDVTLPQQVYDAVELSSCDGMPVEHGDVLRPPRDGARLMVCAQATGQQVFYAYRADTGQWLTVLGLGLSDEVPVNGDMHGHLAALLAERIAPVYGLPLSGEAVRAVSRARLAWAVRYDRRQFVNTTANRAAAIGSYM